ncbi:MAG: hypothetical protein RR853_08895 [Aurantimicrobium sp.]|uniref:hypothetical protein n=1 Tax=Aurantimicrobium sp. TaxID=1930784 RepID=UPI002FCC7BFE
MTDLSSTNAHAILEAWFNQQIDTLTAVGGAIESMHRSVHRAEVRSKMKNKRPKLRWGNRATLRLRRYIRNNPDTKWIFP